MTTRKGKAKMRPWKVIAWPASGEPKTYRVYAEDAEIAIRRVRDAELVPGLRQIDAEPDDEHIQAKLIVDDPNASKK